MAVLVDHQTRMVCQGLTGRVGSFHTNAAIAYGGTVVGGVTPGKGGSTWHDEQGQAYPVWNTVEEAVREGAANASMIVVPAVAAADAILEAIAAGISVIVAITEGIPQRDMYAVAAALRTSDAVLIGPNCPGIISPGQCKIGIMPGYIHRPGSIGIVSRSGTLTYEAVYQSTCAGLGQSTCIGIGGDPIKGLDFIDCLRLFEEDPETSAIMMIGEIGGDSEERACAFIREAVSKPVVGFIAGSQAPQGKRMGHAGAVVNGPFGSAASKHAAMREAGVAIAESPAVLAQTLLSVLA